MSENSARFSADKIQAAGAAHLPPQFAKKRNYHKMFTPSLQLPDISLN